MLTDSQLSKLERIKRYGTRWELVLVTPAGEQILLRYTAQHTRRGIIEQIRYHGARLVELTGAEQFDSLGEWKGRGISLGEYRVRFSGRTQRDAILQGELPYISEVQSCGA